MATAALLALAVTLAPQARSEDESAEALRVFEPAAQTPPHPLERVPADVAARAVEARTWPLGERVKHVSEPWLGLPYAKGPLGEAGGVDPDPVMRFDVFDCLTFIEEVLALSLAPDPVSASYVRMGLRYRNGGPFTYENRRHFMLYEWIPGTIAEGWTRDITPELTGAVKAHKVVTPATWAGWGRRSLFDLPDARLPTGELDYWYLPLDAPEQALAQIPDGSVVFTLRQPWDHLPIAITHVGITIPAEEPTMRHASRMGKRVVRDDKLAWYMKHLGTYSNWPAAGLIVLAPVEFGPAALAD
ncbi:MAG: DUF1460 domain-containing protein [Alphaproteobacteria bacterium]|nr:DUF1460 domain-containing protein [Alphaproteobacteria bacterium]